MTDHASRVASCPDVVATSLVEAVDDDCLIAIFTNLYTCHKIVAAIRFAITCRKTQTVFSDAKVGKPHYNEARAMTLTRMPVYTRQTYPYTFQRKVERISMDRIHCFTKACEMLAMHCATDCCWAARDEFNRTYERKLGKLIPAATGVRLVAAASKADAFFFYARERAPITQSETRARKAAQRSVLRKDGIVLDLGELEPLELVPSPNGFYCAFTVIENEQVKVKVWDTTTEILHHLGPHAHIKSRIGARARSHAQCVWWAPDYMVGYPATRLLVAWTGHFSDVSGVEVFPGQHGPAIAIEDARHHLCVEHFGTSAPFASTTVQPALTTFPWYDSYRMAASNYDLAIFYHTKPGQRWGEADSRSYHIQVVHCDPRRVQDPFRVQACEPTVLYPNLQPYNNDVVVNPIALAVSPSGKHVAVLARCFRWGSPRSPKDMTLALYSWSISRHAFVRALGPKDDIRIECAPTQGPTGWELVFSPCGAYIAVVYGLNRYRVSLPDGDEDRPARHAVESAVHFVHCTPRGLRKSVPVDCPGIRQLAWNPYAMLVAPNHGAVYIRRATS